MDGIDLLVLVGAMAASAVYAAALQKLHHRYSPDFTWLTVVGGNGLIGAALAVFCALGRIPWAALWLLIALNVATGIPIITWQMGQAQARKSRLQQRSGENYATTDKGRT
jgi:drug/metabolite transporter (DMT)-like permease